MRISTATLVMLASAGIGVSASAMATTTTSAFSHEHENTSQMLVRYGDLNVDTAQGAEQLYRRISHAAHKLCSDPGDPMYQIGHAYQRCQQMALEQAVATVAHPKLTALYDRHFPGSHLADAGSASSRGLSFAG